MVYISESGSAWKPRPFYSVHRASFPSSSARLWSANFKFLLKKFTPLSILSKKFLCQHKWILLTARIRGSRDGFTAKNIEWTEWNSEKYGMMGGLVQKPVTAPVVPSWSSFWLARAPAGAASDWLELLQQLSFWLPSVGPSSWEPRKMYHAPLVLAKFWVPFCPFNVLSLGAWDTTYAWEVVGNFMRLTKETN